MKTIGATEATVEIHLRRGQMWAWLTTDRPVHPYSTRGTGYLGTAGEDRPEHRDHERWMNMFDRWVLIDRAYTVAEILGVDVELHTDGGTCERPVAEQVTA